MLLATCYFLFFFLLLAICYMLHSTCYLILTKCYLLLITCYLLPPTWYLIFSTCLLLFITCYLLFFYPDTHCFYSYICNQITIALILSYIAKLERQESLLKAQYMVFFPKGLSLIKICFSSKVIFCNKRLTLIDG